MRISELAFVEDSFHVGPLPPYESVRITVTDVVKTDSEGDSNLRLKIDPWRVNDAGFYRVCKEAEAREIQLRRLMGQGPNLALNTCSWDDGGALYSKGFQ